jgi:hypothetical protein
MKMSQSLAALVVAGMLLPIAGIAHADARVPLSWEALADAKEIAGNAGPRVRFGGAIAALDGKLVDVRGYRIPLEINTHLLVASAASDCESCIDGGPASYVEVFANAPVQPTFGKQLTMRGVLRLVRDEPSGSYYHLTDAVVVAVH